jgi:hypothetical protein
MTIQKVLNGSDLATVKSDMATPQSDATAAMLAYSMAHQADAATKAAITELQTLGDSVSEVNVKMAEIDVIKTGVDKLSEEIAATNEVLASMQSSAAPNQQEVKKHWADELRDSAEFKDLLTGNRQQIGVAVPGAHVKAVMGSTELAPAAQPTYRPGMVVWPYDSPGIVDQMIMREISGEVYTGTRQTAATRFGGPQTTLATDIDGDPTPKNTAVVTSAAGMMPGQYVKFFTTSTGALLYRLKIVSISSNTLTFATGVFTTDVVAATTSVWAEHGFATTAEEGTKPYNQFAVENPTVTLKVLAQLMSVTQNRLTVSPQVLQWIEAKMRRDWFQSLSIHLQYGDGSEATCLNGLADDANVQSYTWSSDGTAGLTTTRADAILEARAEYILGDGGRLGIVMNRKTFNKLRIAKNSNGDYIQTGFGLIRLENTGGVWYLDGMPVIFDGRTYDDECWLIDFETASEVPHNGTLRFGMGYVNDDYAKNKVTLRLEGYVNQLILTPADYVRIYLDAAPS